MDKQIRMSASEVDLYKHIYHSNKLDHNDIALTEAGLQSMNNLLGEIEKIKPTYPDKRWEFWFSVPRGTLKQYIKFNKYYDSEDCSEEKFQKDMEEEFPRKRVWFKIGVINENGYVVIFLDDTVLVRRSPDMKGEFFPDSRLDRILEFLSQTVANTVEILKQGAYNDYVKKELPYENRKGFINRALYWRLVPKSKRNDRDGLKEKEIDKLIKHVKNGNDLFAIKAEGRYERMSSGKYYEVCSYCYAAAGYEELDGKTPKEMFKRHGDERDGGMSLLDENSQDDFDKWFKLSTQEKWEIENPSHMWEISCGPTHTMIHLYLFWDDGYWFYLSGGTHCLTTEVVRMYNAMKDKGVPVLLGHAGQIVDKLLGNDDLGIIPNNDMGWRYWYGGFPKDDVINFVKLSDGNAEAVIKNATWFDIDDVKLADK